MESKKVIRVKLKKHTVDGRDEFFFGSVAAIYKTLPKEVIGVTEKTLANYLWHRNGAYDNGLCEVYTSEIIRSPRQ